MGRFGRFDDDNGGQRCHRLCDGNGDVPIINTRHHDEAANQANGCDDLIGLLTGSQQDSGQKPLP